MVQEPDSSGAAAVLVCIARCRGFRPGAALASADRRDCPCLGASVRLFAVQKVKNQDKCSYCLVYT
eukprot:16086_1